MPLLHIGIPPSGHGYTPPIAVAVITGVAKKGLYCAEWHLRVYYSSPPPLSKKLFVNGRKKSSTPFLPADEREPFPQSAKKRTSKNGRTGRRNLHRLRTPVSAPDAPATVSLPPHGFPFPKGGIWRQALPPVSGMPPAGGKDPPPVTSETHGIPLHGEPQFPFGRLFPP